MSLIVRNAYRYRLADQRAVHDRVWANAFAITREVADAAVELVTGMLYGDTPDSWAEELIGLPGLQLPEFARAWVLRRGAHTKDLFVREYIAECCRMQAAYPQIDPLVELYVGWSYMWDSEFGYLIGYLPGGVGPERLVDGLTEVVEPYSYEGGVMETDHPTEDPDTVKASWEAIFVERDAPADAGASGGFSDFERRQAFGLDQWAIKAGGGKP